MPSARVQPNTTTSTSSYQTTSRAEQRCGLANLLAILLTGAVLMLTIISAACESCLETVVWI